MLTTPTYGFKKPELMDSPPDITVTNPNWDVVEKNLRNHADSIASQGKQIDVLNDSFGIGGMVTTTQDANDLIQGNCIGENLKNSPVKSGWLEYNTSVWFRGYTEYKTQVAKDIVGNQWYRVRNNGTWTAWEDKIGNLSNLIKTTKRVTDLNDFKTNGDTENFDTTTLNKPSFIWDGYVTFHKWCDYESGQQIAQGWSEGGGMGISKMAMRTLNNGGSWSKWQEIATTDNTVVSGGINSFLDTESEIDTPKFIDILKNLGAFKQNFWISRGTWYYVNNSIITDTGCGKIHLAGAVIERFGEDNRYTIRVTTSTTSDRGGTTKSVFIYVNNGDGNDYSPGWFRLATTDKINNLTLQNGWQGTIEASRVGNIVSIRFDIVSGNTTQDTVISTLPIGFRPSSIVYQILGSTGSKIALIQILSNGAIMVNSFSGNWDNTQKVGTISFPVNN